MTIDKAKQVAKFIEANNIFSINLMGGEIFCNPNWEKIVEIFHDTGRRIRIVTNGDWAEIDPSFAEKISQFKNLYICISKDKWHTNEHIDKAERLLKRNGVTCKQSDVNETEFSMVPVGRSRYDFGLYSTMGTYCNNPEHHYSFLIDEDGVIYKCGFGVWDYANIIDYLDGGFGERFKYFNKIFYKQFISSCKSCYRGYLKSKGENIFF
jgi:hypothetical protein